MSARSLIRPGLLLATAGLALTVAACGTSTPTAAAPSPTVRSSTARSSRPGPPAARAQTPPGAFGTAAAVSATSVEVQNRRDGQVTVRFSGSTTFTDTIRAALADVRPGECVVVTAPSGGPRATKLTARTVGISAATATGCTAGRFGDDRAGGPSRPNAGAFGRAIGKVTAVSASGFTVQGVAHGSDPAVTTAVTVNAGTTYTKTAKATASALAVGDCVAALGPADDTGAVTAKSIAVSKPDSTTGCDGGPGDRAGFRGNGNGGGEGGGPAPTQIPGGGNG